MPSVVFLRGVNVGGNKAFQPSALAKQMAELGVVSIGAAGTFVVKKAIGEKALRSAFLEKLPFEAEVIICKAGDVAGLTFPEAPTNKDVKRYVTVLAKKLRQPPELPINQPAGDDWQVQLIAISGRFMFSLHRRMGRTLIYPNQVVEKCFGLAATTRNWNTIEAIQAVLNDSSAKAR